MINRIREKVCLRLPSSLRNANLSAPRCQQRRFKSMFVSMAQAGGVARESPKVLTGEQTYFMLIYRVDAAEKPYEKTLRSYGTTSVMVVESVAVVRTVCDRSHPSARVSLKRHLEKRGKL